MSPQKETRRVGGRASFNMSLAVSAPEGGGEGGSPSSVRHASNGCARFESIEVELCEAYCGDACQA